MRRIIALLFTAVVSVLSAPAMASCPPYSHTLSNGTTADAMQVMDNFDDVLNCMAPLDAPHFTGAVGIGTAAPSGNLDIRATSGTGSVFERLGNATNNLIVGTESSAGNSVLVNGIPYYSSIGTQQAYGLHFGTNNVVRATIDPAGNVGIGTTTPSEKLDVYGGSVRAGNATSTDYAILSAAGDLVLNRQAQSGFDTLLYFKTAGTNKYYFGLDGGRSDLSVYSYDRTGGAGYILNLDRDGNLGIGTTSPPEALTVVGNIRTGTSGTNGCVQNFAGTALTGTCSSDSALKTVTGHVHNVLDGLASLELVRFRWNTTAAALYHNSTSVVNTGFLAQDVERQFPELISRDARGYRQLDYTTLSLYSLEAIKELKAANDRQAAEIVQLRALLVAKSERLEATGRELSAVLRQIREQLAVLERRSHVRTARN